MDTTVPELDTIQEEIELVFGFQEEVAQEIPAKGRKKARAASTEDTEATKPKARAPKSVPPPVLTVPSVRKSSPPDAIKQIWAELILEKKEGFYEVSDKGGSREKGVVGVVDTITGEAEQRVPLDKIKGLFRIQYVSDLQATSPLILASLYHVYHDGPYTFAHLTEEQFNALDVMVGRQITRCYTYHDMADRKRGYTFDHQDFPSLEEQENYRASTSGRSVQRSWSGTAEPESTPLPGAAISDDSPSLAAAEPSE
jgi:hypothetical protein